MEEVVVAQNQPTAPFCGNDGAKDIWDFAISTEELSVLLLPFCTARHICPLSCLAAPNHHPPTQQENSNNGNGDGQRQSAIVIWTTCVGHGERTRHWSSHCHDLSQPWRQGGSDGKDSFRIGRNQVATDATATTTTTTTTTVPWHHWTILLRLPQTTTVTATVPPATATTNSNPTTTTTTAAVTTPTPTTIICPARKKK